MSAVLAERFAAMVARVHGRCETVAAADAGRRVAALLGELGARSVAHSDAPEVLALLDALPAGCQRIAHDAPRERLLAADVGITAAQWGIAETGTLVLESGRERHRLVSLLPATHIALLPRERLLDSLADAFAALAPDGRPDGRPGARTITFVTGPSRTADIELQLVVGVHGPRRLHVLLLDPP